MRTNGGRVVRRVVAVLAGLALVVTACGGADETTTEAPGDGATSQPAATQGSARGSTGTEPPADSAAPSDPAPIISTGDFCADTEANAALIEGIDFFAEDIEAAADQWLRAVATAEAAAPPEISDDVAVIASAARDFVALLRDAEFNPLEIDPTDPRLAALEDGTLDEAADAIAAFCGFEIDAGNLGGSGAGDG